MKRLLAVAVAASVLSAASPGWAQKKGGPAAEDAAKKDQRSVEVVFVLDTTGSMGGLIAAAKEKIWSIANTLATAEPTPTIKMGLVGYRDRGDAYVTKVTDLTDDLDAVYKELMGFEAQGGGDGPESVNQALAEAVDKITWSTDDQTYRVVFLVGDAPPHMDYADDVKYQATCEKVAKAAIVVNTIQCGNDASATPHWTRIAKLAEGEFFKVEQAGGAILATTPFDDELAKLSTELGRTRIYYGKAEEQRALREKAAAGDAVAAKAPTAAAARRAEFLAREAGAKAFNGRNELIDGLANRGLALKDLDEAELPEELKELSPEERKAYVEKKAAEREKLQERINALSAKRQAHIRKELEKQSGGKKGSLDQAIYDSIKKQAAKNGLEYEGGPEF